MTSFLPLLTAVLQAGIPPPPDTVPTGRRYDGFLGESEVAVPRQDAPRITVDGVMDEVAWDKAAVLTGFSQYRPVDGVRAEDETEVRVWYSPEAIHFGIRAQEPHVPVNARLPDRDRIENEDRIQILLDTFDDGRRALVFEVNPLGVQSDGTWSEGTGAGSGLFTAAEDDDPVDRNPDFVFESRGAVSPEGYEIELRIPFASLRYQGSEEQRWRLQIVRRVQHSGRMLTWTAARRERASFLGQSGVLTGFTRLERGLVLDVTPVATARVDGVPGEKGWDYDSPSAEYGGNLRWGVNENLTVSGTVNPDFSQVEADAGQATLDPRTALFFAEKRPFFLEGSERFQTPNRLIHTRRIVDPSGAVKLTGKVASTEVGALYAGDAAPLGEAGHRAWAGALRIRRDVGNESTAGVTYTDRVLGEDYNRVAGADARLVLGGRYTVALQGARSFTREGAGRRDAVLWDASVERSGRSFGFRASLWGAGPDFVAGLGFLSRVDQVRARIGPRYTVYGAPGDALESWTSQLTFLGRWRYDDFFSGRDSEALHFWFSNTFSFRGGWQLDATLTLESFGFPTTLYTDYAVEVRSAAAVDTVPFPVGPRIGNMGSVLGLTTPRSPNFSGELRLLAGRDENFDEWAPAWLIHLTASVEWRPTEQVRVGARYLRQQYVRYEDGTTVSKRDIPRLKVEYQLTRSIFLRVVTQYDARFRDALHDDTRSEGSILIKDAETGIYRRALEERSNDLRWDLLFSYRPVPGTVFFAGYGSSLAEPRAFGFRGLDRVRDTFFLKASYLFRM